jgi:hypothetical protein
VIEAGTTTRTTAGSGGPAGRLQGGGHVAPLRAEALRARRRRQVNRPAHAGRRYPPSRSDDCRACNTGPGPSSVPGHPLAAQDHSQGRSLRSRLRWRSAPPLSVILCGKTSAPIRRTGGDRRAARQKHLRRYPRCVVLHKRTDFHHTLPFPMLSIYKLREPPSSSRSGPLSPAGTLSGRRDAAASEIDLGGRSQADLLHRTPRREYGHCQVDKMYAKSLLPPLPPDR